MKKSLSLKLTCFFSGIVLISCAVLVVTCSLIFSSVEQTVKDIRYDDVFTGYKTEVKAEVQSALTIVQYYYEQAQSGTITEDEAKQKALDVLRAYRYGDEGDGYIWVDDTDYNLVMHPILPDQEGNNRKELQDQNGVKIIQEIMSVANEGGFNEFWFTKSDGTTVAPKIAYSKSFPAWNWVLTTGCYADDIKDDIAASENNAKINRIFGGSIVFMLIESIVIVIVMIIVSTIIIQSIVKVINSLRNNLEKVAAGDLTAEHEQIKRNDELGQMVVHTNNAIHQFGNIIKDSLATSFEVQNTVNSVNNVTESANSATGQIATAMEGIANDATNQAASITDMTAAIEDIQHKTASISEAVQNIGESTTGLSSNSKEMQKHIETMHHSSNSMTEQVNNIEVRINETNETIVQMANIVNSIEEIASETNLLALNASIEAARAGEAGRGFSVVAESIKGLSENTSSELNNIKDIIGTLVERFKECSDCIETVVQSNESNVADTQEVMEAFRTIDSGIVNTSEGVQNIDYIVSDIVQQINSVADKITSIQQGAESSAAASQEVTASVEELVELMQNLAKDSQELEVQSTGLVSKLDKFKVSNE